MNREQLFASFLLDRSKGFDIAVDALNVVEATNVRPIQPVPGGAVFLEGFMRLREDVIPVINLKKRFGFDETAYDENARVAVISLAGQRFGLLFDDILDVLRVAPEQISAIPNALLSKDCLISGLICRGTRNLELLDLNRLFENESLLAQADTGQGQAQKEKQQRIYLRFIIFTCGGQDYGVPVEHAKELTYCESIDRTFCHGCIEGALRLRGRTIPVVDSLVLLGRKTDAKQGVEKNDDTRRILILESTDIRFGMIMDTVHRILTVGTHEILPMPFREQQSVTGLYETDQESSIMLLDVDKLIQNHVETLQSMAHMKDRNGETEGVAGVHHLITENCYLVFTIEKLFAVQIKDVQEIISRNTVMPIPSAQGHDTEVINLRGLVVPVVNMRRFYGYPDRKRSGDQLIICRTESVTLALEVDNIKTIYKQEQYFETPSINEQFQAKKDTVDRLIDFFDQEGGQKHVLVINIRNLVCNHLNCGQTLTIEHEVSAD